MASEFPYQPVKLPGLTSCPEQGGAGARPHVRHQRPSGIRTHGCLPRTLQRHHLHSANRGGTRRRSHPLIGGKRAVQHDDCGRCVPHHRCPLRGKDQGEETGSVKNCFKR